MALAVHRTGAARIFPMLALCTIVLGAICYGYSLDRYPGFYVDDSVFAFPALQAAQGGNFSYPGGLPGTPYLHEVWAYHGPVLLNLEYLIFKLGGFHVLATRLPDFLGAWFAAFLLVRFLNRRGYRYAAFLFAILWCGDRAVQEVMYGRMEGIGLLCLVLTFESLFRFWRTRSPQDALLCGFLAGFAVLIHPLCLVFAAVCAVLVWYPANLAAAGRFCAAALANVPLLIVLWHFHPIESWVQFRYVATTLTTMQGHGRVPNAIAVLRWSKYWVLAVLFLAAVCAVWAAVLLVRQKRLRITPSASVLVLASCFSGAGLILLWRSSLYPYYLVYCTVWPMLCLAIVIEERWRQVRIAAVCLGLIWCSSAAWNVLRLREGFKFHRQLSHRFIDGKIRSMLPQGAEVVTSAALYAIPIEAGVARRDLLTFDPTHQDVCPRCFLLLPRRLYDKDDYVERGNLDRRAVLYNGPAFPGAGPLEEPVVLLSPES